MIPKYLEMLRELAICCYENEADAALDAHRPGEFSAVQLQDKLQFHVEEGNHINGSAYGFRYGSSWNAAKKYENQIWALKWARSAPRSIAAMSKVRHADGYGVEPEIRNQAHERAIAEDSRRTARRAGREEVKAEITKLCPAFEASGYRAGSPPSNEGDEYLVCKCGGVLGEHRRSALSEKHQALGFGDGVLR